ncbi:hypothetical protein ACJX0J_006995, partial [Zea mays]
AGYPEEAILFCIELRNLLLGKGMHADSILVSQMNGNAIHYLYIMLYEHKAVSEFGHLKGLMEEGNINPDGSSTGRALCRAGHLEEGYNVLCWTTESRAKENGASHVIGAFIIKILGRWGYSICQDKTSLLNKYKLQKNYAYAFFVE